MSNLLKVGTRVHFKLNKDTQFECDMHGDILQVVPYGFSAYYVIEYYAVIDFALTMVHHNLLEGWE